MKTLRYTNCHRSRLKRAVRKFLRRNKRKFRLKTEKIEEHPRNDDKFYDKEFVCGDTGLSRRELENLPCPFFTDDVTDKQMEIIVTETEEETRSRLRLSKDEHIDFDNDRHSEIWWEEMEKAVNRYDVPYYEDID